MANMHKHPTRGIRGIDTPTWTDYGEAVRQADTDLSTPIRAFVDWYRGATDELPERPARTPPVSPDPS